MEKQKWTTPEIETLDVNATEWAVKDGKSADGYYDSDNKSHKCWPLFAKS